MSFWGIFASVMRKIAGYLTKNRSGKDQKIAQSTHENEYIKPRKTFWRNSKQLLIQIINIYASVGNELILICAIYGENLKTKLLWIIILYVWCAPMDEEAARKRMHVPRRTSRWPSTSCKAHCRPQRRVFARHGAGNYAEGEEAGRINNWQLWSQWGK